MIKAQTALWIGTAGALISAVTAVAITASDEPTQTAASGSSSAAKADGNGKASNKALTIGSINVTGLVPGRSVVQQLAIGNPNNQDVQLQAVRTVVGGPTPAGSCSSPTDIEVIVAGYNASTGVGPVVTIAKNSSINVPVTVRMNNTSVNQNGCRNRVFSFTFTASANSK